MTTPYNDDTKESYVERQKSQSLFIAEMHHELGNELSMWLHLLTYARAEDIYGEHWDKIHG